MKTLSFGSLYLISSYTPRAKLTWCNMSDNIESNASLELISLDDLFS
jgi:hypothetical protein